MDGKALVSSNNRLPENLPDTGIQTQELKYTFQVHE